MTEKRFLNELHEENKQLKKENKQLVETLMNLVRSKEKNINEERVLYSKKLIEITGKCEKCTLRKDTEDITSRCIITEKTVDRLTSECHLSKKDQDELNNKYLVEKTSIEWED